MLCGTTLTLYYTTDDGTLLSVHSPGRLSPWFQLTSNLRTGQLVMHYRITADEKLHQNSWPLQQPIKKNALLAPDQRKAYHSKIALQDYRPEREWIFDLRWECLFEFALECLWPRSSRSSSSKPAVRGLVLARRLKAQHRGVGLSMDQIRTTHRSSKTAHRMNGEARARRLRSPDPKTRSQPLCQRHHSSAFKLTAPQRPTHCWAAATRQACDVGGLGSPAL
uniref:Uncharacterized protein n=1 Tax=Timema shepardi TaxID=629360 RepID=A0A7R9G034_TIMSH|nr:unnamed protein product [Timema shepardi]